MLNVPRALQVTSIKVISPIYFIKRLVNLLQRNSLHIHTTKKEVQRGHLNTEVQGWNRDHLMKSNSFSD